LKLPKKTDPLTGLVLTIPVYLLYHLGILAIDTRNGVDLVSSLTFRLLDASVLGYVGVTLGLALVLFAAGWSLRGAQKVHPSALVPVLFESTLLAVVMAFSVGWATHALGSVLSLGAGFGPVERIVLSAGAGFHEELVFRVGLVSGGAWVLQRVSSLGRRGALGWALLGSALLFSAVHHLGPLGDPLSGPVFLFRTLAGLYLSTVYLLRGFAVAVYTHALYDLLVWFV
jgi:hypothetical protein